MLQLTDIIGQDPAIDAITRAWCADRLSHGLIFAGPRGVGKATTAEALAGLFLCESPKRRQDGEAPSGPNMEKHPDTFPCGRCAGCTTFAGGNHPDYHVIYKELIRYHDKTGKSKGITLSIDVIRPELIVPANLRSTLGRGKVFVIEQADLMNPQAQNAMLKTLEEPAGRTLIILLTDQPDRLLPTVRSRCQLIRFAPLESAVVQAELTRRGMDAARAEEAAAFAEGSLGLAIKWDAEGVLEGARELTGRIESLLDGRPPDDLPEWFKSAAEAYADRQIDRDPLSSRDQANREGLALYLRLAGRPFRARMRATSDPELLERLCAGVDALALAEQYLHANVSIPLIFQLLAVKLTRGG